ncbi:MAG: hypothetical protein HY646_04325 [Acidobacteria bacterium]|nr:hypothetical protein [Acidobacteriota bacterium]
MLGRVLVTIAVCLGAASYTRAAQDSPILEEVISRAVEYAKAYEAQLGSLIGEEEYVQNAAWRSPAGRNLIARRQQRRLSSDFLILQVGPEWIGVRNVNRADGTSVKKKVEDFQQVFDDSSAASILKTLNSITTESARFNIGDVQRNINLPTFALLVLRSRHVSNFFFKKEGEPRVNGTRTWELSFRELNSPTLVHGINGEDEFSYGSLWIEPDTGRIQKTEMNIGGSGTDLPFHARMVVTYGANSKLGMLVPSLMTEHYSSEHHTIDCRADYFNFHRFEVDVKFDIGGKPPGGI